MFAPILDLFSSAVLMLGIMSALIAIDPIVALSAFAGFGILYWGVIKYTHERILNNGKLIADESTKMIKVLQEGLGGIRDVLIDGTQSAYCEIYRKADIRLRVATGINRFIGISPRYVIEALGNVCNNRQKISGYKIIKEPKSLRHFSAYFKPIKE